MLNRGQQHHSADRFEFVKASPVVGVARDRVELLSFDRGVKVRRFVFVRGKRLPVARVVGVVEDLIQRDKFTKQRHERCDSFQVRKRLAGFVRPVS